MRIAKGKRPARVLVITPVPGEYMEHNSSRRVMAMLEAGEFDQVPAGVAVAVDVEHDAWCALFKGGRCNCSPEVRLRREDSRLN